jgi:hypothetical protein
MEAHFNSQPHQPGQTDHYLRKDCFKLHPQSNYKICLKNRKLKFFRTDDKSDTNTLNEWMHHPIDKNTVYSHAGKITGIQPHPPTMPSKNRRRRNPHKRYINTTLDPKDNLIHLLKRREDGRSIHTPPHIEEWHKRHQSYFDDNKHGEKFNIVKVRHECDNHHETQQAAKDSLHRQKIKFHLMKVQARIKKNEMKAHRPRLKRNKNGPHAQDSTMLHLSLMHTDGRLIPSYVPSQVNNKNTFEGKMMKRGKTRLDPSRDLTNCLLYGWGALSGRDKPHSRKKLAGPSLVQALALSPRAYPEKLPKNLTLRRQPQMEYLQERKKKMAASRELKKNGDRRKRKKRRRESKTIESAILRQLKKSIILLPRLSARTSDNSSSTNHRI